MTMNHTPALPMSIAEASIWPELWDDLAQADLILSDTDRAAVARGWLWLRGVAPASPEALTVTREALTDPALLLALSQPASEFLRWFKAEDWALFRDDGDEAWGWPVLERARTAVADLGPRAGSVSVLEWAGRA